MFSFSIGSFDFYVLVIIGSVNIRFPSIGYTKLVPFGSIKSGTVKDWMKPTVYGIGVRGDKYCDKSKILAPDPCTRLH